MKKLKILHRTYYNFSEPVALGTHYLRIRPREGPALRIESSSLSVSPTAVIAWQSDLEDNAIATANFQSPTTQLAIESEIIVEQHNENPFDFLIEPYAVDFPFSYPDADCFTLAPYSTGSSESGKSAILDWAGSVWDGRESIETISLLLRLADRIRSEMRYAIREEPGVQDPSATLSRGSGSCRDFAALFVEGARHFGLAARFVSGYLVAAPTDSDYGATHAWAEVYVPGAGWKGFDPTLGLLTGSDHIPVAVARLPDTVPPISGSYSGSAKSELSVGVWVSPV